MRRPFRLAPTPGREEVAFGGWPVEQRDGKLGPICGVNDVLTPTGKLSGEHKAQCKSVFSVFWKLLHFSDGQGLVFQLAAQASARGAQVLPDISEASYLARLLGFIINPPVMGIASKLGLGCAGVL